MVEVTPSPWERHNLEQRRRWLALTYEQRLAWLAQAKRFCARALGSARNVVAAKGKSTVDSAAQHGPGAED